MVVLIAVSTSACGETNLEQETSDGNISLTSGEPSEVLSVSGTPVANELLYAAAEEFLSGYLSLFYEVGFTYEYNEEKGYSDVVFHDPITGTPLDDAPYILLDALIAYDYSLYDVNKDGILEIVISYGKPESDYIIHVMYVLTGEKYQEAFRVYYSHPRFFTDKRDKIVLRTGNEMSGNYSVYYAEISAVGLRLSYIIDDKFFNHITQEQLDYERFVENDSIIPGMPDEPIIEIEPLASLKESINDSLTEKLKSGK